MLHNIFVICRSNSDPLTSTTRQRSTAAVAAISCVMIWSRCADKSCHEGELSQSSAIVQKHSPKIKISVQLSNSRRTSELREALFLCMCILIQSWGWMSNNDPDRFQDGYVGRL